MPYVTWLCCILHMFFTCFYKTLLCQPAGQEAMVALQKILQVGGLREVAVVEAMVKGHKHPRTGMRRHQEAATCHQQEGAELLCKGH